MEEVGFQQRRGQAVHRGRLSGAESQVALPGRSAVLRRGSSGIQRVRGGGYTGLSEQSRVAGL